MSVCILLYSHSDYSDIWDLTFGQINTYIDLDSITVYLCADSIHNYPINPKITFIPYNFSDSYTQRVHHAIQTIPEEYILFLHEDWIPVNTIHIPLLQSTSRYMKLHHILHVRSYKNFGPTNESPSLFLRDHSFLLANIPLNCSNFISLQPGIWSKHILSQLYSIHANNPASLEKLSNHPFRKKYFKQFFYEYNSLLAESSQLFPHIHTISNGQWALCNDSQQILPQLLQSYKIDIKLRGYFDRRFNIQVKGTI